MAKQLTQPDGPAPLKPTRKLLEEYLALEEERKALNRQAADIARRLELITAGLSAYVDAHAKGKAREVTTCGHRLSIVATPDKRSIKWKGICVERLGAEVVAEIEAHPPIRESLEVVRV